MESQLAMTQLLLEADDRAREARDRHRGRVHAWFDTLSEDQKRLLAAYMTEAEWDTCASLSVSACDYHRSQSKERGHGRVYG